MSAAPLPDLRRLQELFWRLIAAPEGVEKGAARLRQAGEIPSADLSFLVRSDGRLSAVERLDVYADMYFYRLRDALAEDFPAVREWIGGARFHNLVTDYLLAHPSRHFSLRELGRALPDFLGSHPLEAEFPSVADLARLEWARVDVFDEADCRPLARGDLLARGAAAPDRFAFRLVPAARLLHLEAGVLPRWKALRGGGAPEAAPREAIPVLVWRRDFAVSHRSAGEDEARCLAELASGPVTLSGVGECLAGALGADAGERAPERLAALLEAWTRDALLTAVPPQGGDAGA